MGKFKRSKSKGRYAAGGAVKDNADFLAELSKLLDDQKTDVSATDTLQAKTQQKRAIGEGVTAGASAGAEAAVPGAGVLTQIHSKIGGAIRGQDEYGVAKSEGSALAGAAFDPLGELTSGFSGIRRGRAVKKRDEAIRQDALAKNKALAMDKLSTTDSHSLDDSYLNNIFYDDNGDAAAGQRMNKGGVVKGKGTGTSDSVDANLKAKSFLVPAKHAAIAKMLRKVVLDDDDMSLNKNQGSEKVKVSKGEVVFTPQERKKMALAGIDLSVLAPDADDVKKMAKGGEVPDLRKKRQGAFEDLSLDLGFGPLKYNPEAALDDAASDKSDAETRKGLSAPTSFTPDNEDPAVDAQRAQPALEPGDLANEEARTNGLADKITGESAPASLTNTTAPAVQKPVAGNKKNIDWGSILSLAQVGMGLAAANEKKPEDKIDAPYTASVAKILADTSKLDQDARFGYTPQEKARLEKSAAESRRAALSNIIRYTGSNSSALNAIRGTAVDETNSLRDISIADNQVKQGKQRAALQGDELALGATQGMDARKRAIFKDNIDLYLKNQEASAELINAGLSNFFNGQEYQSLKKQRDARKANSQ